MENTKINEVREILKKDYNYNINMKELNDLKVKYLGKKGELTAMNSLHSGLQNKDTYYLNQFYFRLSNSDNSYKKHTSTGHRTAANSILMGS